MCLIIHKPVNASIPTALLEDAFKRNNDGYGIMFVNHGKIETYKGFLLDNLIDDVLSVQDNTEIFVHLRMKTHGDISLDNCHPFKVSEEISIMHNGIIDIKTENKYDSDTSAFIQMIQPMLINNPSLIFDAGFIKLASNFTSGSRLVYLHSNGRYIITAKNSGYNWCGLWLSNTYAWTLWDDQPKVTDLKKYATSTKKVTSLWDKKYIEDDYDDQYDYHLEDSDRANTKVYDVPDIQDVIDMPYLQRLEYESLVDVCCDYPDLVANAILDG